MLNLGQAKAEGVTSPEPNPFEAAENTLLGGEELHALLQAGKGTRAIYIPKNAGIACLHDLKVEACRDKFFLLLDDLTSRLRPFEFGFYHELGFVRKSKEPLLPKLNVPLGDQFFTVEYCASGSFGSVFKLSAADSRSYALKVFYRRNAEFKFSGPWSETALGAYVGQQEVCDMPRLCLAHPDSGWYLSEFVDSQYRSANDYGPSWTSLGLITLDPNKDQENSIQTERGELYRVDFGHLTRPDRHDALPYELIHAITEQLEVKRYLEKDKFLAIFENEVAARPYLCQYLCWVRPEERLETLHAMYRYQEMAFFPVQDYLTSHLFAPTSTTALFQILMQHPNKEVRTQGIFDIRKLSKEDANYLGRAWSSRAEFSPFMVYLGQRKVDLLGESAQTT